MRTKEDGLNVTRTFIDTSDLLARVNSPCALADHWRASLKGSQEFTLTTDLAEATRLARTGWREGTATVNRLMANIDKRLVGRLPIPEIQFARRGQRLHIAKYINESPRPYINMVDSGLRRDAHVPKIVRVVVNLAASQAIKGDALLMRGAAAIVLVNVLARHRIRCSIDVAIGVTNTLRTGGDRLEYRLRVKQDGEHASVDKMAYFLGHPSALRRLAFSLMEHEPNNIRRHYGLGHDIPGGYGLPAPTTEQGDIYIGHILSPSDWSEALTMAWLTSQLSKQGINLREV